ncbi:18S rRNA pseudouridine methyltransferase [Binucleata daphniae]
MEQIIFVIQRAQLASSKHKRIKKSKSNLRTKKPVQERPDITHQCILTILDSPLNKAGKVKLYIHTENNILIEVNPAIRMPRTINRFNGLMEQLFTKLKIRSENGEILLRVLKNPITLHLAVNTIRVELCKEGVKMDKTELMKRIDHGYTFFVNAIPSGEDGNCEYAECKMKVSDYGLSAATCVGKVCNFFEEIYNIF